jgi:hypothetical protein
MQVVVQQVVTGDYEVRWWADDGIQRRELCSTLEGVGKTLKAIFEGEKQ